MSSLDQLRAVQNERRYPDRVEDAADVDVEVHTHVIAHGARAHAQSKGAFERHPIVLRHVGTSYLEQLSLGRLAPSTHHLLDDLLLLAARGKPRELGRAHQARRGVDQHEPVRALRIGGGEEHGERTALTESANDGPVRAGSVHHRPDVVHARLERRVAGDAVGHARAALVEQKQTPQLHQADEEAHNRRVLPAQLDVVREARDPDEVERLLRRPPGMRCGLRRSSHTAFPVASAQSCARSTFAMSRANSRLDVERGEIQFVSALHRGESDREVLDRQPGRVEDRDLVVDSTAGRRHLRARRQAASRRLA